MSRRIVSMVPSISQTLSAVGLRDEIVGCTQFCVDPPGLAKSITIVGGTKDPQIDVITKLQPTHIIVNAEENTRPVIEACQNIAPTLITFPKNPDEVPRMLEDLGDFLQAAPLFAPLIQDIQTALQRATAPSQSRSFLYLIWQNPWMAVGQDTYISSLLTGSGWRNAYQGAERYPSLTLEAMRELRPDVLLFSSEPYPFRQRDWERMRASWPDIPESWKCDGQTLSWHGFYTAAALKAVDMWTRGQSTPVFKDWH